MRRVFCYLGYCKSFVNVVRGFFLFDFFIVCIVNLLRLWWIYMFIYKVLDCNIESVF